MRARISLAVAGAVAASTAVSAVALGQGSTWGGGAGHVTDAGAADASAAASSSTDGQGAALSTWGTHRAMEPAEGGAETAEAAPSPDSGSAPPVAPAHETVKDAGAADAGDDAGDDGGGGYVPKNVGLSIGLRGGYGVPFGLANGTPLSGVVLGMVPVEGEAGWFFNPHLYVGGYFMYGFGVGADQYNDQCGGDVSCDAEMIRFGVVVHYHLAPEATLDPWFGLGVGYEIINIVATSDVDDSNPLASALQGVDMTAEVGLDYKPLKFVGLGPYVELATGPYLGTDTFGMHGWVNFGVRFRTNL